MTQQRKGSTIKQLSEMKKFKMDITELLEIKSSLIDMTANDKIPMNHIMSLSEIKQEIQPHLKTYTEAKTILEKRLVEKAEDVDGNKVQMIPGDKSVELSDGIVELRNHVVEVKLPTFKIEELGYDPKKPNINKYGISVGAIVGLGRLVERK